MNSQNMSKIKEITSALLVEIGEDTNREGLLKTPSRVAKAWEYFSQGYRMTPEEVVGDAIFSEKCDDIIAVKDIFLSLIFLLISSFFFSFICSD